MNGQPSIKRIGLNISMNSYKIYYLKLKQIRKYFDKQYQHQFLLPMFFTFLLINKHCDQSSCNILTLSCNKNSTQHSSMYASIQTSFLAIELILRERNPLTNNQELLFSLWAACQNSSLNKTMIRKRWYLHHAIFLLLCDREPNPGFLHHRQRS